MTLESEKRREIRRLVLMSLNEDIPPAETKRLGDMLTGDRAAQHYYLDFLDICSTLRNASWLSAQTSTLPESDEAFDRHMWQVLVELERTAPAVPKPASAPPPAERRTVASIDRPAQTNNTLWPKVFAAAALVGLGLFIVTLFSTPAGTSVSRVATLVRDDWAAAEQKLHAGQWVATRDKPRHLTAGIVKLVYDNRAEVVIEGPAVFSCPSEKALLLTQGRACAVVPETAQGFTIHTPCSQFIDLGTEFGVRVDQEGSSTVQVFEGETALMPYRGMNAERSLTQGMAKQVQAGTYRVSDIRFDQEAFVRYINPEGTFVWRGSDFSLVDCIGRGNGFGTGIAGAGISLLTAQTGVYDHLGMIRGANEYRPVITNPFVDGVFIPSGPDQVVSSTGLRLRNCPTTSRLQGSGAVFTRQIRGAGSAQAMNEPQGSAQPSDGRPAIFLHANAGITFDLQAVRSSLPGMVMDRFLAECVPAQVDSCPLYRGTSPKTGPIGAETRAHVFVLIDAVAVFSREVFPSEGSDDIIVRVRPEDRFLTLMVTEGADEQCLNDLIALTAPRIVLKKETSPD